MIGDGATHGVTTTVSGGSLTIGNSASTGAFEVATAGGDLGQVLTVSGGALTYLGTDGLLLNVAATATSVELDGGVTSLTGITLDDVDSAALDSTLVVTAGATLYLGSVGLKDGSTPTVDADASVTLGTATVGALANWSTVVPLALTSGSTATFQAADSNSIAHNITLSGVLSGAGNVAVSGAGSVTLAAINTYTGTTAVNAGGTLIVSGSITGTSATTVASGGNLEVDGLLTSTAAAAVSGKLSGIGSLNGAAVSGAGSVLAPGLTEADASTATGTLTATENVSLASSATLSIRLGLTTGAASDPTTGLGGDVDQLFMNGGSFSLADSTTTLQILDTPAEFAAALDSIYVIVNGSASAPTGTFENALASGDTITTANNETFAVFYDVNAANTGAGNDIDVELVAVPEPGTWASLIGGIGMLVVWQRSRRRRA
jgi:autotransporter-associated beta strand protein